MSRHYWWRRFREEGGVRGQERVSAVLRPGIAPIPGPLAGLAAGAVNEPNYMSAMGHVDDGSDIFLHESSELPFAGDCRPLTAVGAPALVCSAAGTGEIPHSDRSGRGTVIKVTLPPAIAAALYLIPALTPRERATFELLGLGYNNRSIAGELQISERTAKRHVTAILGKLKLESRLQAGLTALIISASVSTGVSRPAGRPAALVENL